MIKNEISKKIVEKAKGSNPRKEPEGINDLKRPLRRKKVMNTADGVMKVRMTGKGGMTGY